MYDDFDLLAELGIAYSRRKFATSERLLALFDYLDTAVGRNENIGELVLILKEIKAHQEIERRALWDHPGL